MAAPNRDRRDPQVTEHRMTLERLAQHYEAFNKTEGKSPRTVEWYSRVIAYFSTYLQGQGHSTCLDEVHLHAVREFVLYLQTKTRWSGHPWKPHPSGHLAPISVQNYVRGLRAFFAWLHREGYTETHRLENLKPPRAPHKLAQILTDHEIRSILACCDPDTARGCRDRAMIVLLLDSGLRLSELANLALADTHIEEGYVKIMGKGSKERIVPIGATAQKLLMRYIYHFRPQCPSSEGGSLFLSLDGRPISREAVRQVFCRLARKSGVKRLHAHLCRHTFATNYLVNGGDVFTLQHILGHTTLEMVKHYVNLASAHVRVQHRRFSPMDRMDMRKVRPGRSDRSTNLRQPRAARH